jgi:hypothetical protein
MGVPMPIPLTQPHFLAIANAAACLHPGDRDPFIAAVAAELHGLPIIGDGSVGCAIRAVQGRFAHREPDDPGPRWSREKARFEHASKRSV